MANMSYCRFENTYHDLLDCEDHFGDTPNDDSGEDNALSESETKYRNKLVQLCKRIADDWDE